MKRTLGNHILIGTVNEDMPNLGGWRIYLYKHVFIPVDPPGKGFWVFGILGNNRFGNVSWNDSMKPLIHNHSASKIFKKAPYTQQELYAIQNLFDAAYSLRESFKRAREVERLVEMGVPDKRAFRFTSDQLNDDLKWTLDVLWKYLTEWRKLY